MTSGKNAAYGHPRDYLGNRHVYAVISQRARGLSLGINLNPDQHCNFDCVYCEVNRDRPLRAQRLGLRAMTTELRHFLHLIQENRLREIRWFRDLPQELLELKEVAFSGDGEPTLCPTFSRAVRAVVRLRTQGIVPFKLVLITNGTGLDRPDVQAGLEHFAPWDEVWVKLDAGTPAYLNRINQTSVSLDQVIGNILALGRKRPVIIQSLFPLLDGVGPPAEEIEEYVRRLQELQQGGAQISLIQVYSAHRPPHRPNCAHLSFRTLSSIAKRVRRVTGLKAEVF